MNRFFTLPTHREAQRLALLLVVLLPVVLTPVLLLRRYTLARAESMPEAVEMPPYIPPQIAQPYFENGRWLLPGYVQEARTIELFGRPVDLVLVQYGEHHLWAALGVEGSTRYESFVDGATTRPETLSQISLHLLNPERFSFILYLPEPVATPEGTDWTLCEPALSEFCHLATLQENSGPVHIDLPRQGQSNLFIEKGYFPEQYRQAVLVWRIAIVEDWNAPEVQQPPDVLAGRRGRSVRG
jgi:hypothetical protein